MPAPFDVVLRFADGTSRRIHQTPEVWDGGAELATVSFSSEKTLRSVEVDGGIWMDATPSDDRWRARR